MPGGTLCIPPASEAMLPPQIHPNPFFDVVPEMYERVTAVPVIEVVYPPSERLIESGNDYFLWQREGFPARGILDLFPDAAYRLS